MKKVCLLFLLAFLVAGTSTDIANAGSTVTFDLNSIISGTSVVTSATSFGTITLTDNGNSVNISINLTDSSWKILDYALNLDSSKFTNVSNLTLTGTTLTLDINNIKVDGYANLFDLEVPSTGNLNVFGTYSDTFLLDNGLSNLDPSDFLFQDTADWLFAALHIGNYNGSSIWVGSANNVPEPSSLLLLGFGLIAAAGLKRKCAFSNARAA